MICDACGRECEAVYKDLGYGHYEYWGATGVHHDYHYVSNCCDADVVEGHSDIIAITIRKARKDHQRYGIQRGEYYRSIVTRVYRHRGPTWYFEKKEKLTNGSRF